MSAPILAPGTLPEAPMCALRLASDTRTEAVR